MVILNPATATAWIAPANTLTPLTPPDPHTSEWAHLGHTHGFELADAGDPVETFTPEVLSTTTTMHASLDVPRVADLIAAFGIPPAPTGHALTWLGTYPDLPPAPVKRRRLTGKAYRAARRAHARRRRAWHAAGRPHRAYATHVPYAHLITAGPTVDGARLTFTLGALPCP